MISGDENINIFEGSKLIRKINIPGSAAASNAVIDSEDNIYIPYNSLGKIIKYSPDGDKLIEFGGKDKFRLLSRIFIDSKNRIYVLDYTPPFNVFVYDSEGKQIRKFALKVKNFRGPEGLAITDDGNIYFNDMNENCIRVYSQSGKLIGKFSSDSGGTVGIGAPGAIGGGQDNYVYIAGLVFNPVKY